MKVITEIEAMMAWSHAQSDSIGFVPTMGNLHAGHQSLLERSVAENDVTVLSVFVNHTQFNDEQDFAAYPKTTEADQQLAKSVGVDVVFMPDSAAMYPDDFHYQMTETHLSETLEGKHRPGHFTGMLTVVMKLLQMVQPTRAYFGEKDWQQLQLVKGMVAAYFMSVEIVACPTVRDAEGLALSSRNKRLDPAGLTLARVLNQLLRTPNPDHAVHKTLETLGFKVEYVHTKNHRRLAAVVLNGVRLIDNVCLEENTI